MKRPTTKEILVSSFREIAERKAVDKITVMDIVENCSYSTTTFDDELIALRDILSKPLAGMGQKDSAAVCGRIDSE